MGWKENVIRLRMNVCVKIWQKMRKRLNQLECMRRFWVLPTDPMSVAPPPPTALSSTSTSPGDSCPCSPPPTGSMRISLNSAVSSAKQVCSYKLLWYQLSCGCVRYLFISFYNWFVAVEGGGDYWGWSCFNLSSSERSSLSPSLSSSSWRWGWVSGWARPRKTPTALTVAEVAAGSATHLYVAFYIHSTSAKVSKWNSLLQQR